MRSMRSRPSLLLEEVIERLPHIIALDALRAAARGQRDPSVRLKVIAEIGFTLVTDVLGLRLAALIVFAWIEETAVFATVHIRIAMRAFVSSRDFSDQFDLSSAIVTDHSSPRSRFLQDCTADHDSENTDVAPANTWTSLCPRPDDRTKLSYAI